MCEDGDLARGNLGDAKATHAEPRVNGCRELGRSGNHHVTAHGTGNDSRMRVSVPWRWKAPRVVKFVSSSRRDGRSGLGDPNQAPRAKARRG